MKKGDPMKYIEKLKKVANKLNLETTGDTYVDKFLCNLSNLESTNVIFYCIPITRTYYELYIYNDDIWWKDAINRCSIGIESRSYNDNLIINDITVVNNYLPQKNLIDFVYELEFGQPKLCNKLFKLHRNVIIVSNIESGYSHTYNLYVLLKGVMNEDL